MYVKKCAICGEMFTTNKPNKKSCSDKCSEKLKKQGISRSYQRRKEKISEKNKQNYVSQKKVYHKVCKQCGTEFITFQSCQKYCGPSCLKEAHKTKDKMFVCEFCGGHFKAESKRKYCTEECKHNAELKVKMSKKPKKPKLTINQIARLSREEGLSYGRYVAKYGL